MSIELYANNAVTAVAGGGYTAGSLVLNVTSTGAPFPGVVTNLTQMHLLIYRVIAGTPTVIVNLVASNTVSGTQWAVAAEGADANALAGDIVICVLSKAGMDKIRALPLAAVSTSGSGTAYTAQGNPTQVSYDSGMIMFWKPDINNTGAVTLNIDGLGAKAVVAGNISLSALQADDALGGGWYILVYDGTRFIMMDGPDGAWTAMTGSYTNGFADFGGGLQTGQYMKDSRGIVHVRGVLLPPGINAQLGFFTLPVGYRPPAQILMICSATSNASAFRMNVVPSGVMNFEQAPAGFASIEGRFSIRT